MPTKIKRGRAPSFDFANPRRVSKSVFSAMPEDRMQKALVEHILLCIKPNIFWCHVPNGGKRGVITGAILKAMGVVPGVPDLIFLMKGQFYALELKPERGVHSKAQKEVALRIDEAGGITAVTWGLDAAIAQLKEWGII